VKSLRTEKEIIEAFVNEEITLTEAAEELHKVQEQHKIDTYII